MKTMIFCEGTTDLLMIQYVLQYKYGWHYNGFLENSETNKLRKKTLKRDTDIVDIESCGGITNIPKRMQELQEQIQNTTREEELVNKVIILIDHDTVSSNREFLDKINEKIGTHFLEEDINVLRKWAVDNDFLESTELDIYIKCLPESEVGAIESIMLQALDTDSIENKIIQDSRQFIETEAENQDRYLQKKSLVSKAIVNTYFAIRMPEEKYDERARVLKAYNWEENEVLNDSFAFLKI